MKAGGGKAKGSAFEREICKELSLWMSGNTRDDLYWRSAMSGGRASVKFKKGQQNLTQTGDITAIDPLGEPLTKLFHVECKFYSDLDIAAAVLHSKGHITRFWIETVEKSSAQGGKLPLLVAKQNRSPVVAGLNSEGIEKLGLQKCITAWLPVHDLRLVWWTKFLAFAVRPGFMKPTLRRYIFPPK